MKNYLLSIAFSHILPVLIIITIHFIAVKETDPFFFDSYEYISIAENILEKNEYSISNVNNKDFVNFAGESPTRMRQPFYPAFVALFYLSFSEGLIILQTVQLVLNIISFFLLSKIGKILFEESYTSITNIILALYFPLWMLSASILTEALFTFLLVFSTYYFLKASSDKKLFFIFLSGILFGLAFLTRPIALFVILALSIFIIIDKLSTINLRYYLILIFGFILVISPWFFRNIYSLGDITPLSSDGAYNFYTSTLGIDNKPWFEDSGFRECVADGYYLDREASNKFFSVGFSNIKNNPLQYMAYGVQRFFATWSYFPGSRIFKNNLMIFVPFTIIQLFILFTAIIGYWKSRQINGIKYLLVLIFGFSFVIFFSYSISRFLIPIIPFVLLLSGQGIKEIFAHIKLLKNKRRIGL